MVNFIAHTCALCDVDERRRRLLGDPKVPTNLISVYMESPHFSNPSLHHDLLQARKVREQYRLRHPETKDGPPYFVLPQILPGQPDETVADSQCKPSSSRVFTGPGQDNRVFTGLRQDSRVLTVRRRDRNRNHFLLIPARTKILGKILAFVCTTDAELMRVRTVSMQFYYLPFQMPYGLNALRGLTDLLAGLTLKPQSAKQLQQGTGDAELFKRFVPRVSIQVLPPRHREDNFLSERQALAVISRLRRVL